MRQWIYDNIWIPQSPLIFNSRTGTAITAASWSPLTPMCHELFATRVALLSQIIMHLMCFLVPGLTPCLSWGCNACMHVHFGLMNNFSDFSNIWIYLSYVQQCDWHGINIAYHLPYSYLSMASYVYRRITHALGDCEAVHAYMFFLSQVSMRRCTHVPPSVCLLIFIYRYSMRVNIKMNIFWLSLFIFLTWSILVGFEIAPSFEAWTD